MIVFVRAGTRAAQSRMLAGAAPCSGRVFNVDGSPGSSERLSCGGAVATSFDLDVAVLCSLATSLRAQAATPIIYKETGYAN